MSDLRSLSRRQDSAWLQTLYKHHAPYLYGNLWYICNQTARSSSSGWDHMVPAMVALALSLLDTKTVANKAHRICHGLIHTYISHQCNLTCYACVIVSVKDFKLFLDERDSSPEVNAVYMYHPVICVLLHVVCYLYSDDVCDAMYVDSIGCIYLT